MAFTPLPATKTLDESDLEYLENKGPVMVPTSWYVRKGKRLFDLVCASFLLLLASPILLMSALLVRLTSSGPVFYSQTRLGKNGKPFTIWKIRSMYHNCEKKSGAVWCSGKGDARVTPVGRFLRRSHFDELPQLWNIFKGDMTLVGPRPERPCPVPDAPAPGRSPPAE